MNAPPRRPSPPSILHVVDSLERGGLERMVTDLALTQHRRGCRVAVFSINAPGALAQELRQEGIEVLLGNKRKSADMGTWRALRRALRASRADIVHAHNFMPTYYVAAARLGLFRAAQPVATCHDMGTRLTDPRLRRIMRWALRRMRRVAMVGAQVQARYLNARVVDAAKVSSILNGVAVDRFVRDPAARIAARDRLSLPQDAVVLGCVGRLVELKNHRLLLELLPGLAAQFHGLRLVLVGGGPLRNELEQLARTLGVEQRVVFAGEQPDVASLLPAFDVFALPSNTEGLSVALLEAAAAALPLVVTDVGGNPEIVEQGRTGLLVPVGDTRAFARALSELLADPVAADKLGLAAREWVERHASLESMTDAYDLFYGDVLRTRGARPGSSLASCS